MTNKQNFEKDINVPSKEQIIIDGVDVSKCPGFEGGCCVCVSLNANELDCEYNPDCYFKQLVRKTQECEELKEYLQVNQLTGTCETCIATALLQNDNYLKALEEIEEVVDDYNRVGKTSQYYRDGLEQILDIINKAKGERITKEGKCQ